MGLREQTEAHFGKRLKDERGRRGWTQKQLADRLTDAGTPVHASTIAKMESETGKLRAVRLAEAAAIADVFGLSLDAMLGREAMEDEAGHAMTVAAQTAQQLVHDLYEIQERWNRVFRDLAGHFDDLWSYEQYAFGDAPWNVDTMSDEHRRAVLMALCRDEVLGHIHAAIGEMSNAAEYRALTRRELPGALRQAQSLVAELKRRHEQGEDQ